MSDVAFEAWHGAGPAGHGGRGTRVVLKAMFAAALLAGVVGMAVFGLPSLPAPAPDAPHLPPAPPPTWREILKPVRIYSLQAAGFAGATSTYTARAHTPGGGREDVLTFGAFDGDKAALRLRIFRRSAEAPSTPTLPEALSGDAAELGLGIVRLERPNAAPTRLGRFEVTDVGLHLGSGAERPCAGFRLALDEPAMAITGLACGRGAVPMSRTDVGCLLERLDVASARDDRELIDFFAASELRRNAACAGMRLGPDGLHAPWLDDKPAPAKPAPAKPAKLKTVAASGKPATARRSLRPL